MASVGPPPSNSKWCFDKSYFEGENIRFMQAQGFDAYIPCQEKKTQKPYDKQKFRYYSEKDEYICPIEKPVKSSFETYNKERKKYIRIYEGEECRNCTHQRQRTNTKTGIRRIKQYPYETERIAMMEKMKTPQAKETYRLRAQTVEPIFADLKGNKDMGKFITRSLNTVKIEF